MRTSVDAAFPDPAVPSFSWQLDGLGNGSWPNVATAVIDLLHTIIPAEAILWYGLDFETGRATAIADPPQLQRADLAALILELDDNPMLHAYLSGGPTATARPVRMSDVVSARDFRRTRTWTELFRPLGVDQQLTTATGGNMRPFGAGWALNRSGRDFSDDEASLMHKLQPILTSVQRPHRWRVSDSSEYPAKLTARELEVLALVADGLTAQAISHRLRISTATVRKHLEHVYAKTGRRDRLMAVRYAQDAGLLVQHEAQTHRGSAR